MIHLIDKFGYVCARSWVVLLSRPSLLVFSPVIHSSCQFRYALYLFRRENPLSPFIFPNTQPPRIPLDIPFAFLHTITLLSLAVIFQLDDNTSRVGNLPPNYPLVYAVTAIAPTYCLLTGQGLSNIVWWSFALVAVALHHFFQSLVLQGKKNISRLEGLKYNARGA
jgi:hypothetical protein